MAARANRVAITFVLVAAVAVAAVFGIRALFAVAKHTLAYSYCKVGDYELDTEQAAVAAQMVGEVTGYSPPLPERAAVLVLAAALQESKLANLSGAGKGLLEAGVV